MYKIPSLPFQMECWARSLGGCRWNHIFFQFTYDIFCNSMFLTYAHNLDNKTRFKIIFLPLKESVLIFQVWNFFYHNFTYFVLIGVIEFPKLTSSILMKNFDHSICPGWSVLFLYVLDHKTYLSSMPPNPILDRREGGGQKGFRTSFSHVTSTNVGISAKTFLAFSFNPIAMLG